MAQDETRGKCDGCPAVHVLNGPNLNLLGAREPEIYGHGSLEDLEELCRETARAADLDLLFRQTNAEHELVEWVHEAARDADGLVINPAAFSHASYALHDALKACACPVIEVHLSNIHARPESWRQRSVVSAAVTGVISGLGAEGYAAAIRCLADRIAVGGRGMGIART